MDLKVKMIVADVMEMVRKVEQTVITDAKYGALPQETCWDSPEKFNESVKMNRSPLQQSSQKTQNLVEHVRTREQL